MNLLYSNNRKLMNLNDPILIFRASEHGFMESAFHKACDGHPNTITIIKSNYGNIFGGYTNIPWQYKTDQLRDKGESFLFLLYSNNRNYTGQCPRVWKHSKYCEISPAGHAGPAFGYGCDLRIMYKGKKSYCWPSSYLQRKPGQQNEAYVICGAPMITNSVKAVFQAVEYEVFEMK